MLLLLLYDGDGVLQEELLQLHVLKADHVLLLLLWLLRGLLLLLLGVRGSLGDLGQQPSMTAVDLSKKY